MELVFFWFLFSVVVGIIAGSRGRSGFGWFILAVLISPLLAFLIVAFSPVVKAASVEPTAETHVACSHCGGLVPRVASVCKHCNRRLVPQPLTAGAYVKCPDCAELILREAKKCKHCGSTVTPQPQPSAAVGPYSDLLVVDDAPEAAAATEKRIDLDEVAARAASRFSRFSRP